MSDRHATTRVRHDTRRRMLTASRVGRLTPNMVRVTLVGGELAGFVSSSYDDHVKLFFPPVATPWKSFFDTIDPDGAISPVMRDFTPRRYDAEANELDIDFALHSAGPATDWASTAVTGTPLEIGGPRGSVVIANDFDWHLMVGDESALPAIGRRLEELASNSRMIVVAAVTDVTEEQSFVSQGAVEIHYVHRPLSGASDPALLLSAVAGLTLPDGEGHTWIAGESGVAKAIRSYLVEERGFNKSWVKAAGYWRNGESAVHDKIE